MFKKIFKDFRHYFWIGIILILISLFLQLYIVNKNLWWNILILFLQTIGVSMFVASLFSFVVDSYSFQEKLKELVEHIVLKRDFLRELPIERKKEALSYLIKPSEEEIEKYSNIEDFYKYFIEEIINVSKKNIRSNYNINVTVKYDKDKNKVYLDGIYSYRLYPSEKGYSDIIVGCLKSDKNFTFEAIINFPNGNRKRYTFSEIKEKCEKEEFKDKIVYFIKVNEFCKEFPHVDIELRVKEFGYNHWMNVFFKAEQATDGFRMSVTCENDLKIKNYLLFDIGQNYNIDMFEENKIFHISCYQWIKEGSGVSLIVSKPECNND
jgi:hypothetical protein